MALLASMCWIGLPAAHATPSAASQSAERFISSSVTAILASLRRGDDMEQSLELSRRMVDMPKMARFSLGRYGRGMDAAVRSRYLQAFEGYFLSVYNNNIHRYANSEFATNGTIELRRGDFIVKSTVSSENENMESIGLEWRVRKNRQGDFRVIDVGIDINGNLLWLMQEQKAQFTALLDKSGGNVEALITQLKQRSAPHEQHPAR